MRDSLANNLRIFLEEKGIDPFYAATIFCILIALSYWKDFKNWSNRPNWVKGLAGSAAFAAIVFSLMSLFRLIGILNW